MFLLGLCCCLQNLCRLFDHHALCLVLGHCLFRCERGTSPWLLRASAGAVRLEEPGGWGTHVNITQGNFVPPFLSLCFYKAVKILTLTPPKCQQVGPGQGRCEDAGEGADGAVRKLRQEVVVQHQVELRSEFLATQKALRLEVLGDVTRHFVSKQIKGLKTEATGDVQDVVAGMVTASLLDQVLDEYGLNIDEHVGGIK